MNEPIEIIQDGYWAGRWLVITCTGYIIKGFDTLKEAKAAYPYLPISKELFDDPG